MLLWRYLLAQWARLFFLILFTLIAILVIARLQEVARFGAICGSFLLTLQFFFYQIPYMIPFALPIGTLLASFLLFDTLSQSHELTALRAAGLPLSRLGRPLFFAIAAASLFNFFCAATLAPAARLAGQELFFQTAASNPLVLMQKGKFLRIKDVFVSLEDFTPPHSASHLMVAWRDPKKEKIYCLLADDLKSSQETLNAGRVSVMGNQEDSLWVETRNDVVMDAGLLYGLIQSTSPQTSPEFLSISSLIQQKGRLLEIAKRLYFFFIPLTCGFLGLSYGLVSTRTLSRKRILFLTIWAIVAFAGYLGGKNFTSSPWIGVCCLFVPQFSLWTLSAKRWVGWQ